MSKPQPPVPGALNMISAGTNIKGDIDSKGDFRIDGKVDGNLNTEGKILIGETGIVTGNITCERCEVSGAFEGKIIVKDLLSITASAKITGEIITGKLQVQPGAVFNGTCKMTNEQAIGQKSPAK
jgi:cytoskeletal protein CcmA (bactofilin family)